ncbi:serine/threonine-protein kinase SMG1 [Prunus yedoensis var. nudiflora]|uniref:Serine/threonine-protein kinase SMG1 n=1 Tax=Prunus yedoensis var. nudiflora TaxID=2094558 RepID=A0A314ZU53_PRUYE|nr:serine/threonine-protein kinase SMG1 [Prunus yedoensis var. nudiflora]
MMNAGLALQCHDATIQYCALRLQELRNLVASSLNEKSRSQVTENLHNMRGRFSADILRVVRHMALALCKTHESEALHGLEKWVSMTLAPFLVEENQSLSNSRALGPFTWVTGLVYQAEESWLSELQTLRAKHAGKSYCGALTTTGNEINAIHALARYDEGEFQAAWACLGLTPKSSSELTLDPKLALQKK